MSEIALSITASAVRPHLWKGLLDSLRGGKYKYEVVFAGFIEEELYKPYMDEYPEFKYIETNDIKPCACYELSRRYAVGKLLHWTADDSVYSEGFVDKVVDYYNSLNNPKAIISCKTNENGMNETMLHHRFYGRNQNTPLMCPLGIIDREYLQSLGGYDRRFLAGQYENSITMEVLADGGKVYLYEDVCVTIDHKNKHGSETNFWNGYNEDRECLENSWVIGGYKSPQKPFFIPPANPGEYLAYQKDPSKFWFVPLDNNEVTLIRNDKKQPFTFSNEELKKRSEGPKGQWQ